MPSREYQAEAENILPEGFWPGQALEARVDDPGALTDLMLKAAAVLEMVGGTFSILAIREEIGDGLWVPSRYVAKWESYAPGRRAQKQQPQPVTEEPSLPEPPEEPEPLVPDPASNSTDPDLEEWPEDAEAALAAQG